MKPISVPRRFFSTSLILMLGLILVVIHPLEAEVRNAAATNYYHTLFAGAVDPVAEIMELIPDMLTSAGSSYNLRTGQDSSMPMLVACDELVSDKMSVLVAVDLNHVQEAAWSLSVWLSMLQEHLDKTDACSVAFAILPPRTGAETFFILEPGESFWVANDPYKSLADLNPQSVILLDMVPESPVLSVEAEVRGKLSPLRVLKAMRSSLEALNLAYSENAVKALYARAGLIDGSTGLMPWLELGVPAVRLQGQFSGQIEYLPAVMQQSLETTEEDWATRRDVNYLRYQLPVSVISLDDIDLTRIILVLLAVFMASVALKPLFTPSHAGKLGSGALPEAFVAYLFSFIAVSISWSIHGFAARLFGSESLSINLTSVALAIGILGRLASTMLFFFALSGLSARLGLLPHAVRGTASQAAAMIAGVLGMSVLFFSIQGSLLLFGIMILLSLAGVNAAVAVLSISVLVMILLPLVVSAAPVFIPGLVTILNAEGRQLLLLAGFTAPIALWILTTLSPRHRLVRGDRTAPYLVAAALALCFFDPWLRTRL